MKLACPECRRDSEPARIYCHDCGARLDRFALAKEKSREEDPKETQRRLRSMLNPHRAKSRQRFFGFSKLSLGALLLAAIIQMLRPPHLPARPKDPAWSTQINMDLENAATDPRVGVLRYSDEQVNAYLAYTLQSKQVALTKSFLKFERAVVDFQEGFCDIAVERSLFGLPVVTSGSYTLETRAGKIAVGNRGGYVGRMPVHPALMKSCNVLFADVRGALERDRKLLAKLGSIEFHPQTVSITAKAAPQT